jgi:hypothetical protein
MALGLARLTERDLAPISFRDDCPAQLDSCPGGSHHGKIHMPPATAEVVDPSQCQEQHRGLRKHCRCD